MTDDAIILETLKFIYKETKYKPYVNIITTLWKGYEVDKQDHLKRILLKKKSINLNMDNHWEYSLTAEGMLEIETGDIEVEKNFLKYLTKQSDIEWFMLNNFIKPDPTSKNITNETDEGVIFLKRMQGKGLIEYDKGALSHVNDWHVDGGKNPKKKRWFNTLHEPLHVVLTDAGQSFLASLIEPVTSIETTFSDQEANTVYEKIEVILASLEKLETGHEIIFDSIDELKADFESLKSDIPLGKRRWYQRAFGIVVSYVAKKGADEVITALKPDLTELFKHAPEAVKWLH